MGGGDASRAGLDSLFCLSFRSLSWGDGRELVFVPSDTSEKCFGVMAESWSCYCRHFRQLCWGDGRELVLPLAQRRVLRRHLLFHVSFVSPGPRPRCCFVLHRSQSLLLGLMAPLGFRPRRAPCRHQRGGGAARCRIGRDQGAPARARRPPVKATGSSSRRTGWAKAMGD